MSGWQEIGDRVFVRRYRFYDQNIGVVLGDAGVLVVDTRTSHRQMREVLTDLREVTPLRVTRVVNTHMHADHCFGNAVLRSPELWGHERCARALVETGERQRASLIREFPDRADEWREVEIVPPTRTFTKAATVTWGDRTVELRYLGRGHTDNDVVVLVPDAGVLFAGDLLENGAPPFFGDGYPMDWPRTAERLVVLAGPGAVVPGHGAVADRAFAERQLAELAAIAALAGEVDGGRLTIEDAVAAAPYPPEAARAALDRALAQLRGALD